MHILIIEDEEQLCRSVAEGLRIDGYETDICFDGDEGLCLCMTENYDLILHERRQRQMCIRDSPPVPGAQYQYPGPDPVRP